MADDNQPIDPHGELFRRTAEIDAAARDANRAVRRSTIAMVVSFIALAVGIAALLHLPR